MVTSTLLYWLIKFDSIIAFCKSLSTPVTIFLVVAIVVLVISWLCQGFVRDSSSTGPSHTPEEIKKTDDVSRMMRRVAGRIFAWTIPLYLITHLIIAFLPTTREAAAIYIVPTIANNKGVQAIPEKLLSLANNWLDELQPASVKKVAQVVENTTTK